MAHDFVMIVNWWWVWFVLGIISLPVSSWWLSRLWDRGYVFGKALGLFIVGYAAWLLVSLKLMSFGMPLLLSFMGLWLMINAIFLKIKWSWYKRLLAEHWWQWLKLEIVFLLLLTVWSFVRGFQPDINGLEKFMDHGFVNSIMRSESFPPRDMWFAGGAINYYYFGHYLSAVMTMLSGISSAITYNLMIATVFALSFVEALVLGASAVGIYERQIKEQFVIHEKWKVVGGVLAAFFLTMRGNLQWGMYVLSSWLFELMPGQFNTELPKVNGLGDGYAQLSYLCLHPVSGSTRDDWYSNFFEVCRTYITLPNPDKGYWYPDATRFIPYTIHEFPIYSFVVADLHAHMINLIWVLLLLGGVLCVVDRGFAKWSDVGIWGVLIGVFYMTNAWDVPIYLMVIGAVLVIMMTSKLPLTKTAWSGLVVVSAVGLTGLYWVVYSVGSLAEESQGVEISKVVATVLGSGFTWTLVLLLILGVAFLVSTMREGTDWEWTKELFRGLLPKLVAVLGIGMIANLPFQSGFEQIAQGVLPVHATSALSQLWVLWGWDWFLGGSLVSLVFYKVYKWFRDKTVDWGNVILMDWIVLGWYVVGVFLIVIPEFIYVKDIYISDYHRANTMFKLVYQSWTLFALAGAYTVVRLASAPLGMGWNRSWIKWTWLGVVVLGIFVVGKYPGKAIHSYYGIVIEYADGSKDFKPYKGLDGEVWLKKEPSEYAALQWLKQLPGQPVILEAVGDSYTEFNRFSANTGLPTVQGWKVHEWLWRGSYDQPGRRDAEVEHVYTAEDLKAIKPLYNDDPVPPVGEVLRQYGVEYVIVGTKERERYKEKLNEENFKVLGELVFGEGDTRIYRIVRYEMEEGGLTDIVIKSE